MSKRKSDTSSKASQKVGQTNSLSKSPRFPVGSRYFASEKRQREFTRKYPGKIRDLFCTTDSSKIKEEEEGEGEVEMGSPKWPGWHTSLEDVFGATGILYGRNLRQRPKGDEQKETAVPDRADQPVSPSQKPKGDEKG